MHLSTVIHTLFLCLLNVCLMVAGIFLNSVVIISIWKSSQLRKKRCYFMILLLSCFDLPLVAITHPVLTSSTIFAALGQYNKVGGIACELYICMTLQAFSMLALFVLNMERFLALSYPFFHQAYVTKGRLILFLAILTMFPTCLITLSQFNLKTLGNLFGIIYLSAFLSLLIYLNCKMFIIARSKRVKETGATPRSQQLKISKTYFKTYSTCSLAVACYCVCFCPQLVYSTLRLTSMLPSDDSQVEILRLWTFTLMSLNSTLNCLIFFWRNSVLRCEGMKTVKCFSTARS